VADDDVHTALATMKQHRIRRLPVLGFGPTVIGVISMNDIVLAAGTDATFTITRWWRC
jgi:CBS domain-containing protein